MQIDAPPTHFCRLDAQVVNQEGNGLVTTDALRNLRGPVKEWTNVRQSLELVIFTFEVQEVQDATRMSKPTN